jgi:sulfatase maturation enzyme AslB (radical SAM superfamily)
MSTLANIKVLHLESTDVCNLACPLCARETDNEFDKSSKNHLTIEQIQQHCSVDFIKNLDKMFMCGNYGDPAAGRHTLDIFKYFRSINPTITLGMNTNGGLRNTDWWQELAGILNNPHDYVIFSIDGLSDTNHLYRVNSTWDKLVENAQAYIGAGGTAHWDMLVYKHNEHQVDQCQELAQELGFKWFRAKVSRRPLTDDLEYPVTWNRRQPTVGKIDCHALREQSIFIDAQGRKSPCCWLGSRQSDFVEDISQVQVTWDTATPDVVCASTCTVQENITNFENQWQREVAF